MSHLYSFYRNLWFLRIIASLLVLSGCNIFNSDDSLFKGEGTKENPYQVSDIDQLQAINNPENLDKHYIQTKNIDASKSEEFRNGSGFNPIGDHENPFTGSFNGNGFVIQDLHLPFVTGTNLKGLFGYLKNAQLSNITIDNSEQLRQKSGLAEINWPQSQLPISERLISTDDFSEIGGRGGLVAINDGGLIRNCHFLGYVGTADIGAVAAGLVGVNNGIIENSSFEGSVWGMGLVNWNLGEIRRSHVSARMSGMSAYGLVSTNDGIISQSSADVEMSGNAVIAGLVRENRGGLIESSYAIGHLNGIANTAGLVIENSGKIINSYSLTSLDVKFGIGHDELRLSSLVVENQAGGIIETSYAAGPLTLNPDGAASVFSGGVASMNAGEIRSAYWDREATGLEEGVDEGSGEGAKGLTTVQMTGPSAQENMPEFDWINVWTITPDGYPIFRWQEQ